MELFVCCCLTELTEERVTFIYCWTVIEDGKEPLMLCHVVSCGVVLCGMICDEIEIFEMLIKHERD